MYPRRIVSLVLAAVSAASVAQALWLSPDVEGLADVHRQRQQKRQGISVSLSLGGGGQTALTTPSTTATTPTPSPSTTSSPEGPSTTPPPLTTSSIPRTTSSRPPTTTSEAPPITQTITAVVTTTNSDGLPTSYTTAATTTSTPGLSQENTGTSSMSPQTRNIVIGVVVGVGGAVILAALGLLAWRIWGRKKATDDGDDLMAYGGPGSSYGAEKSEMGSSAGGTTNTRTPFQSTLESYHAPTNVNPSANF